jgi:hypothetical protein
VIVSKFENSTLMIEPNLLKHHEDKMFMELENLMFFIKCYIFENLGLSLLYMERKFQNITLIFSQGKH